MDNITIGWVAAALGLIAGIFTAVKTIDAPFKKQRDMATKNDAEIKALSAALKEQQEMSKVILSTLNAMVNHMIDGNGIEDLKKVRNELQKAVIEK